jgi:2-hydroxy-3-oxopropionate reductase
MAPLLARQARRADNPRALADTAEIVVVSLPTLPAFRDVVFGQNGLLQGRAIKTLINTCTVGVPFVTELAEAMAKIGCVVVDCPISGGPGGAAAGTLSVMVSGDPAAVESVRPLISLWGSTVTVAGDSPGAAQLLKLTNNILFAVSLVATSEAFVMGAKGGLDPKVMLNAINAGSGANGATRTVFPRSVLSRSFDYGAALHILMKDVDLAIAQGEALGVPMWVCQAARLVYKHAVMAGHGNDDIGSMVRVVEQGAGFTMPRSA